LRSAERRGQVQRAVGAAAVSAQSMTPSGMTLITAWVA